VRSVKKIVGAIADKLGIVSNVEVADLKAELADTKAQRDRYKKAYENLRDMIRDIKIHEL
jgi:hypothetical protein